VDKREVIKGSILSLSICDHHGWSEMFTSFIPFDPIKNFTFTKNSSIIVEFFGKVEKGNDFLEFKAKARNDIKVLFFFMTKCGIFFFFLFLNIRNCLM
jgi:hypothetical protein